MAAALVIVSVLLVLTLLLLIDCGNCESITCARRDELLKETEELKEQLESRERSIAMLEADLNEAEAKAVKFSNALSGAVRQNAEAVAEQERLTDELADSECRRGMAIDREREFSTRLVERVKEISELTKRLDLDRAANRALCAKMDKMAALLSEAMGIYNGDV